ncbi:ATP-dependent Clp protease proteolytic subunit 4, chloroplastic [Vitis vinifera]|uniref:ATP-dependent Clp protease proteolytic subunit n=1 Tax=Vitis vinifera TaxID=29760 RepID=A0A438HCU1_VITVI|nr:ATP-dependent Clp protease proteolytic subunit 4, chloroplastic [Vitis vinifera]
MGLLSVSSPLPSLGFSQSPHHLFPQALFLLPAPLISASLSSSPSLKALNPKTLDSVLALPLAHGSQTPGMGARGAEADAMGLLLKERIVFLGNNVDDFVADAIISQLLLLDAQDPTKDIRLFINSPGGSLSAANLWIREGSRESSKALDVSTVALGISASTASIILGVVPKASVFAMPNTRIMIHQPLGVVAHFEQVEKDIDRDRYMSPIEAVEYGIIDAVIDRDSIIPLVPVPEKVKSRLNYEEISKDPRKFLTPDIPDDEIY